MILTHKIRIKINQYLNTLFQQWSDCSRFSYNWVLGEWERRYKWNKEYLEDCEDLGITPDKTCLYKISAQEIRKDLLIFKNTREDRAFLKEAPSSVLSNASLTVGVAYKNFFEHGLGYPKFKKKHSSKASFKIDNNSITYIEDSLEIKLPKVGVVQLSEPLKYKGKIMNATISKEGKHWYISLPVELRESVEHLPKTDQIVGIDLGVKDFAILSTGEKIQSPKPLKKYLKKIKRIQRVLSRKKKGSNNRSKVKTKLSLAYLKVSNVRSSFLHNTTKRLVRDFDKIAIEDLSVKDMMTDTSNINRAVLDVGLYEFRRQLEYKTKLYGKDLIIADKYYPSSKLCSCCGYKKEDLSLDVREWICPECSSHHDRDINAAKNLLALI